MKNIKRIMKDEEGLTLVELLAVVVIMAIIAGIAAVSISKVIQRTREDAQVVNVQQMLASANLYDIQEEEGLKDATSLTTMKEEGVIKSYEFVKGKEAKDKKETADTIVFNKNKENGEIIATIPKGSLIAGQKASVLETISESDAGSLNREKLFSKTAAEASK